MTEERSGRVSFQTHIELLQSFLARREEIVEKIQGVLNAQRKPAQYLQDRSLLSRDFADCFFMPTAVADNPHRLIEQLEEARRAGGFTPRQMAGLHNDLVDPVEMTRRGFHLWQQTRWPGRNGRVRYAHTLFNLHVIRYLELLSLRLWDAESSSAGDRLAQLQDVLDELWRSTPADQPAFLRDARWLIPLAQSPTTDELAAYFEVAERVSETLAEGDRLEIQKAHVRMIAGHLRSQIRHYCLKDSVSLNENSVVLRTRTSNALDFALLIQALVPLLEAYEHARHSGDSESAFELAGVICQSISPDPELLLNRVDLLGAYSMIEHLFVTTDRDGQAAYTPMGRRHIRLFQEYEALIGRLSIRLSEDCGRFRPVAGAYSPYGAIYGTPTHLVEDMALKALQPDAETRFGLEDVFANCDGDGNGDGDAGADKLAWISGLRKLPHVDREVQRRYEYPQKFAEDIFDRIEGALRRHVTEGKAKEPGRLFILNEDDLRADSKTSLIPDLPARYIGSSDIQIVAAQKAVSYEQARLLRDRQEGHFLLSYETPGGWVAIQKDILTEVMGAGRDAKVAGLPPAAAEVLRLMCLQRAFHSSKTDEDQGTTEDSQKCGQRPAAEVQTAATP